MSYGSNGWFPDKLGTSSIESTECKYCGDKVQYAHVIEFCGYAFCSEACKERGFTTSAKKKEDGKMTEGFAEWLRGRPQSIKDLAQKLPPNERYRIVQTGQHCSLYSYFENGTVSVTVDGHDHKALAAMNMLQPFNVFGLKPTDLEVISSVTGESRRKDC